MECFFATCPRGLEGLLGEELAGLGATGIETTEGGVGFNGSWSVGYRVNLESRLASRVLWRIARGRYHGEEDIYRLAYDVDWPGHFAVERTFAVSTVAHGSPVKSLNFVTLRIKDAVCDRFRAAQGLRPSVDTRQPDVRIHAFLDAHHVTLYLDTSGEALFKRGWRKSKGEAPLRENLAAGILLLAGYRRGRPLLDPMCGSGTLLMEAAMMALDIAPGLKRGFAFERLENFDAATFSRLREDALARRRPPERLPIWGSDVDPQAIEAARQNFLAAGLAGAVTLEQQDVLDIVPPAASGLLVTNPPYGERMGDAERLAALYPQLATVLKRRFPGWTACFLSSDLRLPKLMRLKPARRIPLMNGPLECRLFVFELVAGSHRRRGKDDTAPA